ncbi:MAG TPA: arginine--tRNA ligase [Candidatus Atribacteria bacterium]|nr:arginine--tRNA ligase [Candidatus Atribacteria bacterium]HPT78717.1 arginine--tRNA ligase [Candidatus Atribacteria bacterium]
MYDAKLEVSKLLSKYAEGLNEQQLYDMLEVPPSPEMGDLALPCFKLSKHLRKPPVQIAESLAASMPKVDFIDKVEAVSGYVNIFLNRTIFVDKLLAEVLDTGKVFGSSDEGRGKNIVIDFSSPNIAKPFHIGHLRSTVIGNALYRMFKFMGYNCIGINYLGDWGTQFGKLIVAYKKWGDEDKVRKDLVKELVSLYVRFHEEAESDPSLEDEARYWFAQLEKGNEEALALWRWFVDISLEEYAKIYDVLGVKFDLFQGEAFFNDKMEPVVNELKAKGLLVESEGAMIVDLEDEDMPPCLILKSDGSTLYATRDITAAIYRKNTFDFYKCIYVTGVSQSLHFKQVFKVIEKMGYDWHKDLHHVPFGTVSIGGEKLATRTGKVILLEDLLTQAISKTAAIIEEKNADLPNKEEVACQMGVGAVIFSDLFSNRIKDVSFSWDEILNFDGETGPYVQYTHARACSVLRKAGGVELKAFDASLLKSDEEYSLAKTLADFPSKVKQALDELEPSIITRYLVDVAHDFNRFYHVHSILVEDEALRTSRLALTQAAKTVLKSGLELIGLSAPERV